MERFKSMLEPTLSFAINNNKVKQKEQPLGCSFCYYFHKLSFTYIVCI